MRNSWLSGSVALKGAILCIQPPATNTTVIAKSMATAIPFSTGSTGLLGPSAMFSQGRRAERGISGSDMAMSYTLGA